MDNENNFYDQMDYDLCKKCGKRRIDRSENPDSILCSDCRQELIKLKIPPYFYIIAVIVVLMMGYTFIYSLGGLRSYSTYNKAQSVSDKGYIITSMNDLMAVLEENPEKSEVAIELADIAMEYNYYEYADYAISNYLVGVEVSETVYDRMIGYITTIERYYNTCVLAEELIEEAFSSTEDDDEALEICHEKMKSYIGDYEYDQSFIYYYLGYTVQDAETRNDYFESCVELNPFNFEVQAQIANYYRRQGDVDKAREIIEEMYYINREDVYILRSYATIQLVDGYLEHGLDFAKQAYERDKYGDYVMDTYVVALVANGMEDEANALVSEYEELDYEFDDEFYEFLAGNMTLQDYYIGE